MASGKIEKVNQQDVGNYTPIIGWRSGGTAPTLGANIGYKLIVNKNLMIVGFRIQITNVGSPSENDYLTISLPTGITLTGDPFPTAGMVFNLNGVLNLYIRGILANNCLQLVNGIIGNPSSPSIGVGWLGGFGFVPVKTD